MIDGEDAAAAETSLALALLGDVQRARRAVARGQWTVIRGPLENFGAGIKRAKPALGEAEGSVWSTLTNYEQAQEIHSDDIEGICSG